MDRTLFESICRANIETLKKSIIHFLESYNYEVITKENFIIAEGGLPICLIAHLDTVFKYEPTEFFFDQEKKVIWSPTGMGADDRAGICAIIDIIASSPFRPSIVLLDGEEVGGIGAQDLIHSFSFCPFKKCNALIELDRANHNDAVYYDCDNEKFEQFITGFGFETDIGTFSDISFIAPAWGIAAVNLSIGYESEHSLTERLHFDWYDETVEKVKAILLVSNKMPFFKYIPFGGYCLICGKNLSDQPIEIVSRYKICKDCYKKYY